MPSFKVILLVIIFSLGFLTRLYRFDNPVADWHAFRQSDTNAVSERFAREGINFLYPKYYDISNIQSGLDNPEGYRFVEFPIYNAVQALLFNLTQLLSLPQWGRLITIFASLSTGLFIFLLTKKYSSETPAYFALAVFLFLPYSIFYGRVILPDPSMAAAIMGGIYFFDKWLDINSKFKVQSSKLKTNTKYKILNTKYFILAVIFTSTALLLKPFALFFTIPMIYLSVMAFGFGLIKKWQLWLYAIFAVTPFVLWRYWIASFPEGIPASAWLFNGNAIRFRPAFFKWIFYERITKLIFGYSGIIALMMGLISLKNEKNALFFCSFILSTSLYLIVIATGNVQHDYYQIAVIPTLSMIAGLGLSFIFNLVKEKTNLSAACFIVGIIIFVSFYFSFLQVKDYFNINDRGMVAAGEKADQILPRDATIIAPYDGSTTLLNIAARPGWPTFQKPIEELIALGATHMVIANPTENDLNGFGETYKIIEKSDKYLILKLK